MYRSAYEVNARNEASYQAYRKRQQQRRDQAPRAAPTRKTALDLRVERELEAQADLETRDKSCAALFRRFAKYVRDRGVVIPKNAKVACWGDDGKGGLLPADHPNIPPDNPYVDLVWGSVRKTWGWKHVNNATRRELADAGRDPDEPLVKLEWRSRSRDDERAEELERRASELNREITHTDDHLAGLHRELRDLTLELERLRAPATSRARSTSSTRTASQSRARSRTPTSRSARGSATSGTSRSPTGARTVSSRSSRAPASRSTRTSTPPSSGSSRNRTTSSRSVSTSARTAAASVARTAAP